MPAPYRVRPPGTPTPAPEGPEQVRSYFERVMKMIPMEIVSLYLVGASLTTELHVGIQIGWAVACLACVFLARILGTREAEREKPTDWALVAISAVAFVIWVYTLGGPFKELGIHIPIVGSLIVLLYTFVVPLFYRGKLDTAA